MREDTSDSHDIIRTGPRQFTCRICNQVISKPQHIRRCQYCNEIVCKTCLEHGLCPEHYELLDEKDKEFFKKNYKDINFYAWLAFPFMIVLIVWYALWNFDVFSNSDTWVLILVISIEGLIIIIYSIIMVLQIRYRRKIKPKLIEVIKKDKRVHRKPDYIEITSVDSALEKIIGNYKNNPRIRAAFIDEDIVIGLKFLDTSKLYTIIIRNDQEIFIEPNSSKSRLKLIIRIRTEQTLIDVMNNDTSISDAVISRKIMIGKGAFRFARLSRKLRDKIGPFF